MSNPLVDMEKPEAILCIGTNMTECHPVAATRLKRAVAKGARMVVADPRRIPLVDYAELYLPIRVGSDVALLLGMAHVIERDGLIDDEFVAERTEGIEAFREHLRGISLDWSAEITGVPVADIEKAAHIYGGAGRAAIYYTLGITEHITGVDNVQSLCNLALMTGNLGKEGAGINPMRGQNNIQGAGDCGAIPANFPGFQPCNDPKSAEKFSKLYGREIDCERGITKVTALEQAGDLTRAMLIVGENTVVSDPDRKHCEHALKSLDHLVVIDVFPTETTDLASVVLPATGWGETDGTYTNTERRVQRVRAAVPAQGMARPEWWILSEIAKRCGIPGFEYESAADVFNELCSVSPIYAGLDWESIGSEHKHWPVPTKDHPGTPVLHEGEFKNGRGKLNVIHYRDPAEVVDDEYPVWMTTGRRLEAYHTRTMTGRSGGIDYLLSHETLEVHPDNIEAWGLSDGGWAKISSRRGSVVMRVESTPQSPRGTVFCSFSFGDVPVNHLTGGGYDPVTQTAELKVCPVKVEPAAAPA